MPITDYPVDPELARALAPLLAGGAGTLLDLTDIPLLQRRTEELIDAAPPAGDDLDVVSVDVPRGADGGAVGIRMIRPRDVAGDLAVLVWCHPGGQVVGRAAGDDAYLGGIARSIGCVVAAVDYRLAPQTRAPGAAEDVRLAYEHLITHADELAIDPARIGIAGASGGGAVAAAAALMIRDRALPTPALLSLAYPMLDDRNATPSSHAVVDLGVWDREENRLAWEAVLGEDAGHPELDPYRAAGRADDLSGLPPLFVAVGDLDLFRDEDVDFAARAMRAGVPTDLHVYAGAFHAFDRFAPGTRITASFEATWHAFLARRLER